MKNSILKFASFGLLLILFLFIIDIVTKEREFLIIYDAYATNGPYYIGYESNNGLDTIYGLKRHYIVYNYDSSNDEIRLHFLIDEIICQEISNSPISIGFYEFTFEKMKPNASKYKSNELVSTSLKWGEVNLITTRSRHEDQGKLININSCTGKTNLIPRCSECKYSEQIFPPAKNISSFPIK